MLEEKEDSTSSVYSSISDERGLREDMVAVCKRWVEGGGNAIEKTIGH